MNDKIKDYFAKQYSRIRPPVELKQRILRSNKNQDYIFAIVISSVFLVFVFSVLFQLSQPMDSIINSIVLP